MSDIRDAFRALRATPDGRWVVFRSNMFGPTHVFAVEVKASPKGKLHHIERP